MIYLRNKSLTNALRLYIDCQPKLIIAVFQVGTGVTGPTMVAPKYYSHYITDRHRHVEVYVHNLEKEIFTLAYWSNR